MKLLWFGMAPVCIAGCLAATSGVAAERVPGPFNERVLLRVGAIWASQDTTIRVDGDSGLGIGVDLESFFDLEEQLAGVWQVAVSGRFRQRHRIGFEYYAFNRSAQSVLTRDWQGEDLEVSAGARADTKLNLRIAEVSYAYAFMQQEKQELSGSLGLYGMGLDFAVNLTGDITVSGEPDDSREGRVSGKLGLPLPVFGLQYAYAFSPRWLVEVGFKYFALRTNVVSGSLVKFNADTRYYFWDHFEVGAGLTLFDLAASMKSGSFDGRVDWSYWGPQVFLGAKF